MPDHLDRLRAALRDRYAVERELGSGGMATVYLAEDLKHRRKVAVKVLRPELAASLGSDRFFREIEVAARLQHPHILPLHDSGEAAGYLYYVMPFVDGESLRDRLAREGELPVHEAVRILAEVVDALASAHTQGVVHRDIKPDNVMLSGRHALVTDFGVAKAVTEAADSLRITETGVSLGTPAYMAPEQAVADPHIDHRADIYAVGVLGYELLTGDLPFRGATAQEVLVAHVTQPPEPISARRAAVPAGLEAVLMKCLEKRPADRWQSATELLQKLEPLLTSSGGVTPTQTAPVVASLPAGRRSLNRPILAVGTVLALAALGVLVMRRGPPPALSLGKRAAITLDPGLEMTPAISPDGKMIAYSRLTTTGSAIVVRQLAGGAPVTVAQLPALQAGMPSWSPGGDRLLYLSPRGLEVVPALGGGPRLIVPLTVVRTNIPAQGWGSWAPDGERIVYGVGDTLFTRVLADSAPRTLVAGGQPNSPAWSPDGKWIAYVSGNNQYVPFANLAPSSIWVVPAEGGTPVRITEDRPLHASPVWLPGSGDLLYVSNEDGGRDIYRVRLTGSGRPEGPAVRLSTGLDPHTISLSSDGRHLVYSLHVETSNVFALAMQPGRSVSLREARPVTSGAQIIEGLSVSPDGRWLAFDSNRDGNQDIWRMPLDGSTPPEQLTATPQDEFHPAYSADGMFLAFHRVQSGSVRQLFVMPASGGAPEPVRTTTTNNLVPHWSPTGQALSYLCSDANRVCIVRKAASPGSWQETVTILLPDGSGSPSWSPDGSLVAFSMGNALAGSVPDSGVPRAIATLPPAYDLNFIRWAGDSRTIYFSGLKDDARFLVYAVSRTGGPLREVAHSDGPSFQSYRFSFDVRGNTLYLALADRQSDVWMAEIERP